VLAERLRAHELRRLASILRVRIAPDPAERPAREARSEDLERLADEAGGRIDRERWREALVEREVSTLAELERLDRDLRALEAELARRDPRELEPELARRETPAGEAELTRRASPAGGRANGEEASEERGA